MAEKTGMDAPGEQRFGQRKVSYTDILNRMRTSTFARRRTAPDLFTSNLASSSSEPQQEQPQALPRQSIPSRASRGSSFFSELNTFIPRSTTSQNKKEVNTPEPKSVRQPRKITNRYFQQHSCFNSGSSEQDANEILIPKPQPKTQITQRALMQPISNPPLPRRSTMGNLTQNLPGQIPNFMRPTSSSAARRNTARVVSTTHAPTKTVTPNKARARLSGQTFRPRNFSLPSSSRLSKGQVPESATPATPPKLPVEPIQESTTPPTPPNPSFAASKPSNQSERPILTMNSNLTFEEMLRSVTPDEELNQVSEETAAIEETSDEPAAEESGSTQEYLQIRTAQPTAYWAGRMTSLSDRFRNEALESGSADMHDDKRCLSRVFAYLRSLCVTKEAVDSLEAYQHMWATRERAKDGGIPAPHEVYGGTSKKRGVLGKWTGRKK